MAIGNFIPEVWAKTFDTELEKILVFYENTSHKYEGLATKPGDAIKILGIGSPTLTPYSDGKLHQIPTPEAIQDMSQLMPINQVQEFAFYIDDLEKRQAEGGEGLLAEYIKQVKYKVGDAQDSYIAGLIADDNVSRIFSTETKCVLGTAGSGEVNILDAIDRAILALVENNVRRTQEITLTAPPKFVQMLKNAYVDLDTNNSEMLKNGRVGRYAGITIKESTNVAHRFAGETNDVYHIQVKTNDAIAFVKPYLHMEAYRPDDYFQDAIKGYSIYDGKVVKPKEIVDLNVYL